MAKMSTIMMYEIALSDDGKGDLRGQKSGHARVDFICAAIRHNTWWGSLGCTWGHVIHQRHTILWYKRQLYHQNVQRELSGARLEERKDVTELLSLITENTQLKRILEHYSSMWQRLTKSNNEIFSHRWCSNYFCHGSSPVLLSINSIRHFVC